jgi:hypothetical protein
MLLLDSSAAWEAHHGHMEGDKAPSLSTTHFSSVSTAGTLRPLERAADEEHEGDCCELCGAEDLESG